MNVHEFNEKEEDKRLAKLRGDSSRVPLTKELWRRYNDRLQISDKGNVLEKALVDILAKNPGRDVTGSFEWSERQEMMHRVFPLMKEVRDAGT